MFNKLSLIFRADYFYFSTYKNDKPYKNHYSLKNDNIVSEKKNELHLYQSKRNIYNNCVGINSIKLDSRSSNKLNNGIRYLDSGLFEQDIILQSIYASVFFSIKASTPKFKILQYLNKFNQNLGCGKFIDQVVKTNCILSFQS